MRILFIDDEPLALEALRRSLRGMRLEWQMSFAESGETALRMMAEERFEMVVSDLLMPGMGGMQFLGEVRRRYPGTLRLVLSGYSDSDALMECAACVHQVITKPCQVDQLRAAIQTAFGNAKKVA